MRDELAACLARIENALLGLGREALQQSLRRGIDAAYLRAALSGVGVAAPRELVSLYSWRNGTSTTGVAALDDIYFFPGFYLLSVEDAVANYQAFVADSRWASEWFPVFADGGGDFYVLDLSSPETHPVRRFRIDESEHPTEFLSLEALLATIAEGFERGVIFVDGDGYLEMDDSAFGDLAAELNPDVDWWRS